jgi:L-alanine-DL-glutamate epimerase-like enolase superfamily enzyme
VHFVSAIPNAGEYHEFKGLTNPASLPFECKTSSLKTDGGVVRVPTGPGSGIEIDPDFIKKHTVVQRDRGRAEE